MTVRPPRLTRVSLISRLVAALGSPALIAAALSPAFSGPVAAQILNPFWESEKPPPKEEGPPTEGYLPPPFADKTTDGNGVSREALPPSAALQERQSGVEREDLAPVMAQDGSGLPYDPWNGLSGDQLAQGIAALDLPPRSPTLAAVWRRLITSNAANRDGSGASASLTALRVEALHQSGLIEDAAAVLAADPAAASDPVLLLLTARNEIGLGNRERGCEIGRDLRSARAPLPKPMQGDLLLIGGYCAALAGDTAKADLQAGLLRELEGGDMLAADLISGGSIEVPPGSKLSLLDYRIAEIKGGLAPEKIVASASPALLAALARDPKAPADLRLSAGEAAAAINAIPADDLAALYRAPGAGGGPGSIERASLFKQAEVEQTPLKKARLIRAFLDEARRANLYWPALQVMAAPAGALMPVPEIGWFAETAIEIGLASGNLDGVRRWAEADLSLSREGAPDPLAHWLALADIADPSVTSGHDRSLAAVTALAHHGRFDGGLLNRLVTVLDALAIGTPMPLSELASRGPQPPTGHLPDTGVLSELADASKKRQFGRTVLLAMRAIGPDSAAHAHMIALGDSIRALKRAGLEADAHRLALEGLFDAWPRVVDQ